MKREAERNGGNMNVVLFVIDTLRADHLGCYGYFRDTSPTIDRLAAEGVRFADSHATADNGSLFVMYGGIKDCIIFVQILWK